MSRSAPFTLVPLLSLLVVFACKSEIDGKPAAKVDSNPVTAVTPNDKPESAPATATIYKVDPATSSIAFVGAKVTGDHKGSFAAFTGEATITGGKATGISFSVDTASVTTDAEDLTGHLKGADFFDVEKFPRAAFTSTAITEKPGDGGVTHEISGDLELHGVKKSVTFPAKVTVESTSARGEAEFTINRKDFEIVYAGKADDLIKDEVLLRLSLNFAA